MARSTVTVKLLMKQNEIDKLQNRIESQISESFYTSAEQAVEVIKIELSDNIRKYFDFQTTITNSEGA